MAAKRFNLIATVNTDNLALVGPVLKYFIGDRGTVEKVSSKEMPHSAKGEFRIQANLDGTSAKDLNRSLLSALRKAEKRTRLRAAWSYGGITEQYFDYVLKKTVKQ